MSALERRRLGQTNLYPTRLALGAAHMGGMVHAITVDEVRATLQRLYDLGVRYLDTSPLYGNSQENLGKAMQGMDLPELLISTKVGSHPSRQFSYTAEDLRWSLDDSSRLLGRERLDLVLIHDSPTMEPVMAAGDGFDTLEALRAEGRLEAIGLGVRDFDFHRQAIDAGRVDAILTYADYNLVRQSAAPLIRHAKANGVGVILGSPQMQGLLAHGDPMIALKVRPNLSELYPPEDIQGCPRVVRLVPRTPGGPAPPEHALRAGQRGYRRGPHRRSLGLRNGNQRPRGHLSHPIRHLGRSPGTGGRPGGPGGLSRSQRPTDPPPPRRPLGACGFRAACRARSERRRA